MKLFTIPLLIALLSAGCNSGKKVEAQSRAAEPAARVPTPAKPEAVKTQPTLFEWRGIHDGMTLAEFQAKNGNTCVDSAIGYACASKDVTVVFRRGQVYSFQVTCDSHYSGCNLVLGSVKAHFGKPKYNNVKYGQHAILWQSWQSSLEIVGYQPPDETEDTGQFTFCSPELAGPGQCLVAMARFAF